MFSTEAVELVRACVTRSGFLASPIFDHHRAVRSREAALIGLGALVLDDADLIEACVATVDTLVERASSRGQMPAVVWPGGNSWDWGEGGAVDATAWTVILAGATARRLGGMPDRWRNPLQQAMVWLSYQDVTGSGLISAAPSSDWMDASLGRSGRTLHLNVLYAWAAAEATEWEVPAPDPDQLKRAINLFFWPEVGVDPTELYPHGFRHEASMIAYAEAASTPRRHYLSHVVHAAMVDRCDVLANLLAIVAGVPDRARALRILDYLDHAAVADPYPSRTFPAPIPASDPSGMWITMAEAVVPERWRNRPGRYHNGAVWPMVGAVHVWALALCDRRWEAERLQRSVKLANRLGDGFPEWIHPDTGEPHGAFLQGWNAGAHLLAEMAMSARSGGSALA